MRKGTSKASSAKAATRAGADVGVGFGGWELLGISSDHCLRASSILQSV